MHSQLRIIPLYRFLMLLLLEMEYSAAYLATALIDPTRSFRGYSHFIRVNGSEITENRFQEFFEFLDFSNVLVCFFFPNLSVRFSCLQDAFII